MRRINGRICMITSVHRADDVRVFFREASALSDNHYEVILIAPHEKEESRNGVKILPLPNYSLSYVRRLKNLAGIFKLAIKTDSNVYHIFDPELIILGLLFKCLGGKVVYDVLENFYLQVLSKNWLPYFFRRILSLCMVVLEFCALVFFDEIIVAGEDIALQPHFRFFKHKLLVLRNFPLIYLKKNDEALSKPVNKIRFVYSGGLSSERGIMEIIKAFKILNRPNTELILLGSFSPREEEFRNEVLREISTSERIKFLGLVPYQEMFRIIAGCHVGMICFKPAPNNIGALSGRNNKIYEYMQAGLAIIGSNFPLWKKFIEGNGIGVTVDPFDLNQIKEGMEFLVDNPIRLSEMGKRARLLSKEFVWEKESEKLIRLYKELLNEGER